MIDRIFFRRQSLPQIASSVNPVMLLVPQISGRCSRDRTIPPLAIRASFQAAGPLQNSGLLPFQVIDFCP